MAIALSKELAKKIATQNNISSSLSRENIAEELWSNSSKKCHLCDDDLNRSSDEIEIDHNNPESEGGDSSWNNLRLAHKSCNRFKRNLKTKHVRPLLKFKRYFEKNSGKVNFELAQNFFGFEKKRVFIEQNDNFVVFELPNKEKRKSNIHNEKIGEKVFKYCFVDLRMDCVGNDAAVQPRDIKIEHLFSIAQDLYTNPLHEQPACRLEQDVLLLFDGQHKTLAKALNGSFEITYKIYLNLNREDAVVLVNSVQSKIKKLPLTPLELSAKFATEFNDKLQRYSDSVSPENVSEKGFIDFLDAEHRTRARSAIKDSRIDSVIKNEPLILAIVDGLTPGEKPFSIKQPVFRSKVLEKLLITKPLTSEFSGEQLRLARETEAKNISFILDLVFEEVFAPALRDDSTEEDKERAKRAIYQSSIMHVAIIIRQMAVHFMSAKSIASEEVFLHEIGDNVKNQIKEGIKRIYNHPIWRVNLDQSTKTRDVKKALMENTGAEKAFERVGLHNGYCVGAMPLPENLFID